MKIGNIIGVVCTLLAAAAVYVLFTQKTPREKALAALRDAQWPAEGAALNLQLDACQLDISITRAQADGASLHRSRLLVDLSDFNHKTVNIRPVSDGGAIVTLIPKPISDPLLSAAQNLLSKVPEPLQNRQGHTLTMYGNDGTATQNSSLPQEQDGPLSKPVLRNLLEQPNAKLTFQLRALIPDTEVGQAPAEIQPHADAPALFDFVNAVETDTTLTGYSFSLVFNGTTETRETLVLGGLEFPTQVRFTAASENQARDIATAVLRYSQASCR